MLAAALVVGCALVPSNPTIVAQWDPDRQWGEITLRPDFGGWDAQVRPIR